jgi:hypothetical protein
LQVGYVGAGDEQNRGNAREQDQKWLAIVSGEILPQRLGNNLSALSPVQKNGP